jgi:hypothetical protein
MITIQVTRDEVLSRIAGLQGKYTTRINKLKNAVHVLGSSEEHEVRSMQSKIDRCQDRINKLEFIGTHLTDGPFVMHPKDFEDLHL